MSNRRYYDGYDLWDGARILGRWSPQILFPKWGIFLTTREEFPLRVRLAEFFSDRQGPYERFEAMRYPRDPMARGYLYFFDDEEEAVMFKLMFC